MKTFGIVSYNKYANLTNYGSALQSWALNTAINKLGERLIKKKNDNKRKDNGHNRNDNYPPHNLTNKFPNRKIE